MLDKERPAHSPYTIHSLKFNYGGIERYNMKKYHIATSVLTNKIYGGKILKKGAWAADKEDLTIEALVAVAEHVLKLGVPVEITSNGKLEFRITVEKASK